VFLAGHRHNPRLRFGLSGGRGKRATGFVDRLEAARLTPAPARC
jgi:hypothetical protein